MGALAAPESVGILRDPFVSMVWVLLLERRGLPQNQRKVMDSMHFHLGGVAGDAGGTRNIGNLTNFY